jgi:hypothetical protein
LFSIFPSSDLKSNPRSLVRFRQGNMAQPVGGWEIRER